MASQTTPIEPLTVPPPEMPANEPEPTSRMVPLWVGFIALAVILVGALWFYYRFSSTDVPSVAQPPAAVLFETNAPYAEGVALYNANKFSEARSQFEKALLETTDPILASQIKLKIAHTVRDEGDSVRAIQLYKEIVMNDEYPLLSRAYAAQSIAVIADFIREPAVREEIFSTEPFASFVVSDNVTATNRRLFEYATSLYPLALSELQVALWYADRLRLHGLGRIEIPPDRIERFRTIIAERLGRADTDMARVAQDENDAVLLPEMLRVRALTLSALAVAGFGSHEDADRAYVEALEAHARFGAPGDAYMRLWYAYYLAGLEERKGEVAALVQPLYTNPIYRTSPIATFLSNERNDTINARGPLKLIAGADRKFKDFLISLGWVEADFN